MKTESTMIPEWAYIEANRIINKYETDPEVLHEKMDDFLCKILRSLGYGNTIDLWQRQEAYIP